MPRRRNRVRRQVVRITAPTSPGSSGRDVAAREGGHDTRDGVGAAAKRPESKFVPSGAAPPSRGRPRGHTAGTDRLDTSARRPPRAPDLILGGPQSSAASVRPGRAGRAPGRAGTRSASALDPWRHDPRPGRPERRGPHVRRGGGAAPPRGAAAPGGRRPGGCRTRSSASTTARPTPPRCCCSGCAASGRRCESCGCGPTPGTRPPSRPGLARARGQWVVTIDADLQDPPETIGEMLAVARGQGVDVVYGVRSDRSTDTAFKRITARAFYRSIRAMSDVDARVDAGDFRLMSRATVDAVNALPEHGRVLRPGRAGAGLPERVGGLRARRTGAAGDSKYPLGKMIRLSVDGVTGFSIAPLRFATWMGLLGGVAALAVLVYALVAMLLGNTLPGWTSTVVIVAAVGAVQLLALGHPRRVRGAHLRRVAGAPGVLRRARLARPGVGRPQRGSDPDLTVALDDPLGRRELGQGHRAPGVQLLRSRCRSRRRSRTRRRR